MRTMYRLSVLPLLAVILFASCKQKVPIQAKYIPKQANIVASLNTGVVKSKLLKANFTPATIWNFMKQEGAADSAINQAKTTWADIKQSGINIDGGLFAYNYEKGNLTDTNTGTINGFVVALNDATLFAKTLQAKAKGKAIIKASDFEYINADSNQLLAWNAEVAMLVSYSSKDSSLPYFDTATSTVVYPPADTTNTDSIKVLEEVTAYFGLKESQSVASIKEYRNLMQTETDGTLWYNLAKRIAPLVMLSAKADALFADVYLTSTFNFDQGAVAFETNLLVNDQLADFLEKYGGKGIDSASLLAYPSTDINLINAFKFDPTIIDGLIKELDLENQADALLKQADSTMSIKDFSGALGGDIHVFLSDFTLPTINKTTIKNAKDSIGKLLPSAKFLFSASVANKTAMDSLLAKWFKGKPMTKTGNTYSAGKIGDFMGFQMLYDDKYMMLYNDSAMAAQFRAGTGKSNLTTDVLQQAQGKSGFFYLDLAKILSQPQQTDSTQTSGLAKASAVFKDIMGTMNNIKGNTVKGRFEVRLKNDKENSLVTLLQMITGFVSITSIDNGVIKVKEAQLLDIPSRLGMM